MTSDPPLFRIEVPQRQSGGGWAVTANLSLASKLHPDILGSDSRSRACLVPRNWVRVPNLRSRQYVLMPQNAWPWEGSVGGVRSLCRRLALRAASEISMNRALGVIRMGTTIPPNGRVLGDVLGNVLDEDFENVLDLASQRPSCLVDDRTFVSIGSLSAYRGLSILLSGYAEYRRRGGSFRLVIAGPSRPNFALPDTEGVTVVRSCLKRHEVLAAFHAAAAAVFPSTVEASPIGVLEANVVAQNLVLTGIPGHLDAAERGLWFDRNSWLGLADALCEVESNGREQKEPFDHSSPDEREANRIRWAESLRILLLRSLADDA